MYKNYFGLNENPFSIAPNPRYLYMSNMHQEALAHLVYGASSDSCIVLLTGDVGTGKTTISRCFLEQLSDDTDIAVIINPKLTGDELLSTICDEFQIIINSFEPTTKNYIDSINTYLLEQHSAGKQAVLIIDEAQNLDLDVLEMLRLLTNLETNSRKLLKIFLLGQSELVSILERPDLAQINQRITSRYHLKGLEEKDVSGYISHRISVAGGGRTQLFNKGAVREISMISRGVPRLINSICDHALLGAYSENREKADKKIIRKAARELLGKNSSAPKQRTPVYTVITAVSMAAALLCAVWYGISSTSSNDTHSVIAPETAEETTGQETLQPDEEDLFSESFETTGQTTRTKIIIQPVEIVN